MSTGREAISSGHSPLRRLFTPEEDARLVMAMHSEPFVNWDIIAAQLPGRTARQCRERWLNYLSPGVRSGPWTKYEDELLVARINELGRAWSIFTRHFNGRSENDIKNRWYSHLKYQTVLIGRNLKIVSDAAILPERRKRKRAEYHPKEAAIQLLAAGRAEIKPRRERECDCSADRLECDLWDRFLPDDVIGQQFNPIFDFF
jgi:hypothetical protein